MNIENLAFQVKGRSYAIRFPNVGDYRNIEAMKHTLSANTYGSMTMSRLATANEALDMIDIEAYLTVLCPKLLEDLRCSSFSDLGIIDYRELRDAFKKQFVPWWQNIESMLRPEPQKVQSDEEAEQY